MTKPTDWRLGLTAERLRSCLHYDPASGSFVWLRRTGNRRAPGDRAGEMKPSGYVLIGIDGRRYRAHRLAWLYMTGEWPTMEVDHRNGIRSDNSWSNLRLATQQQNQANSRRPKNNTSGFKGVFWNKQRGKWAAKINPGGRQVHLGFFDNPKEAAGAYRTAAQAFFGDYARAA